MLYVWATARCIKGQCVDEGQAGHATAEHLEVGVVRLPAVEEGR